MTTVLKRLALILFCSGLCACASDEPGGRPDGAGPGGPSRRLPNVFISPAGQPFRAPPGAPYPAQAWFAEADLNHDGKLTREEMRADALRFFDKLDANHDGVIDGLEVQAYEQDVAPEILPRIEGLHAEEGMDPSLTYGDPNNTAGRGAQGRRGPSNRPPAPSRGVGVQGAAVFSMINTPEPVSAADTQFDGRITRAEFGAAVDRRFDLLDSKEAGYLSLATLPKTPLQLELIKRAKQAARQKREHPEPTPQP